MNKKQREKAKALKQQKKEQKRDRRGWFVVTALHDCGCCWSELFFKSEDNAVKMLQAVGLKNGANIVDDKGTFHEGIDTFYGFQKVE